MLTQLIVKRKGRRLRLEIAKSQDHLRKEKAMDIRDIPIRPMTTTECKEYIAKAGGYDAYRKKGSVEVALKPQEPRALSKGEQYLDACKLAAQYRGISIEQLFKQEPERYKQYCRLVMEE